MPILALSRADVLELLSLPECIEVVEEAFRLHAEGRTVGPGVLSVPATGGGFHIKAAGVLGERRGRACFHLGAGARGAEISDGSAL